MCRSPRWLSEANGLSTGLGRGGGGRRRGGCWERDRIVFVTLSRQKDRGPLAALEARAATAGAWGGAWGPRLCSSSPTPLRLPSSSHSLRPGERRMEKEAQPPCNWRHSGRVIASSALRRGPFLCLPSFSRRLRADICGGMEKCSKPPCSL